MAKLDWDHLLVLVACLSAGSLGCATAENPGPFAIGAGGDVGGYGAGDSEQSAAGSASTATAGTSNDTGGSPPVGSSTGGTGNGAAGTGLVGGSAAASGSGVVGGSGGGTAGSSAVGHAGTQGIAGASSSGGAAGSSSTTLLSYTFDSNTQGWSILMGSGASTPAGLQSSSGLVWANDQGDPSPGALKLSIPFDSINEFTAVSIDVGGSSPLNLSGKTLSVRVRLASGLSSDPSHPGGVKAYAKGGSGWAWANGPWSNTGADQLGSWHIATLALSSPDYQDAGYTATDVREIGVQVCTAGAGNAAPAVIYIDSVVIQ